MKPPRLVAISLFTTLALITGACGGSKSTTSGPGDGTTVDAGTCPVGAFKKAPGVTTVKLWHTYVGKLKQALDTLAAQYNASQSKVKVEPEVQGTDYSQLLRKVQAGIPTKQLPAITIGEDIDTQFMADSNVVVPATACLNADPEARKQVQDIIPAVRSSYTLKGIQYPASMNVSTIVLYYNKDHFRAAGLDPEKPPTTLAEVQEYARKIKAAGASEKPFVMKMDPWFVEHWVSGAKELLVNNDNGRSKLPTKALLESKASKASVDWLATMNTEGLLNAVPGTEGQYNHYLAMASGKSSMLLETSAAITTIDGVLSGTFDPADIGPNVDLPAGLKVSLDLGVGLNPGLTAPGRGQIGGGAWYITNTGSKEVQSAAWDFVKYFNTTQSQVTWTISGSYLPILESVKTNPELQANWTTTQKGKWQAIAYSGIETLDPKFPGPLIGPYDKFRDAYRKAIEDITLTGQPVDPALKEANVVATKALVDYTKNNF